MRTMTKVILYFYTYRAPAWPQCFQEWLSRCGECSLQGAGLHIFSNINFFFNLFLRIQWLSPSLALCIFIFLLSSCTSKNVFLVVKALKRVFDCFRVFLFYSFLQLCIIHKFKQIPTEISHGISDSQLSPGSPGGHRILFHGCIQAPGQAGRQRNATQPRCWHL